MMCGTTTIVQARLSARSNHDRQGWSVAQSKQSAAARLSLYEYIVEHLLGRRGWCDGCSILLLNRAVSACCT